MALILGIDPGSRVTGYGVIQVNGNNQTYVASGCIRTAPKQALPQRLHEIHSGVCEIINEYQPDEVSIEKVFVARSVDSALKLGQARGAALVACAAAGCAVFEYEARKIKQAVVGSGAASKDQVQQMVTTLLKLNGTPQADAADALAIAICHSHSRIGLGAAAGRSFARGRLQEKPA